MLDPDLTSIKKLITPCINNVCDTHLTGLQFARLQPPAELIYSAKVLIHNNYMASFYLLQPGIIIYSNKSPMWFCIS